MEECWLIPTHKDSLELIRRTIFLCAPYGVTPPPDRHLKEMVNTWIRVPSPRELRLTGRLYFRRVGINLPYDHPLDLYNSPSWKDYRLIRKTHGALQEWYDLAAQTEALFEEVPYE